MPKNIVICCDGTWNSATDEEFGMPASTNVRLLFQACQTAAESNNQQVTWYQSGIGALGSNSRRAFEGATGTGMGANIRRSYLAIARHYEPGDRIFLFGFSRGAFTARSVAGMIRQVGLVEPDAKEVEKAYRFYESTKYRHNDAKSLYNHLNGKPGRGPGQVRIHFIGVWDTVGSLGFSFWGWSFNLRFFRNGFHELSPNSITDNIYQALAMDEIRTSFMPSLWEPPQPGESRARYVEQAWFRGVHSDVGGGYSDRDLANIALDWMVEKAVANNLLLRPNALQISGPNASLKLNPAGRIHRSFQGPLWTSVGGWPRWFNPLLNSPGSPGASEQGYLHNSVFVRHDICLKTGTAEQPFRTLKPGDRVSVDVRSDELWNNTGLILEAGVSYHLQAQGYWQDLDDTPFDPQGQPANQESIFKKGVRWARRAPELPWMHLVGMINYPRPWPWTERPWYEALYFLFIADPKQLVADLFSIGLGTTVSVEKGGVLWVFANDMWKFYANNTGSVTLTVSRPLTSADSNSSADATSE